MAKWNDRPSWTEFDNINNGQEFTRILPSEALNALAQNIHYLYSYGGGVNSAIPIEVSTEAEMTELLKIGEIGGVYKYTGTTGTYENGALYVLEATDETAPEEPDLSNTFTINGYRYTMENRMTWYEWCKNVDYNTDNFQCASETAYVYEAESENVVTDAEGTEVLGGNIISVGNNYLIKRQ